MKEYSLNKIEEIDGKQVFYKLEIGGVCQFDEYVNEIIRDGQYIDEYASLIANMEDIANLKLLPKTKFRDITLSKKDKVKEYEFKTKHLRVYAIKNDAGKLILLGGYKNSQKKDINKFRALKDSYLKMKEL